MSPGKTAAFLLLGLLNLWLGLWLLGYAAYWFLLVLDETAGGKNDVKVVWPDETFRERLWKLGHLAFLGVIWALPVVVVFRYAELPLRPELQPPLIVMAVGAVVWLMLPISLLSSMTGDTHWEFFRWAVLWRLIQRFPTWMAFYAYTFPLMIGCVLVTYLALFGWAELYEAAEASSLDWLPVVVNFWSWGFVLPLTAVMAATALLIYARLLGRLAWMLDFWEDEEEEEHKPAEPETPASGDLALEHDALEPAALPETAGVIPFAAEPKPAVVPQSTEPVPAPTAAAALIEPEPPAPRQLWVRGIYRFPWYRGSLAAWLFLTLVGLLLGVLLRLQLGLRS
jgi:hypothetical protein